MQKTKNILSWGLAISFFTAMIILLIDFMGIITSPSENTYRILVLSIFVISILTSALETLSRFKPPKKKLKIGLDIHGVCDANPEFFSELSRLFVNAGHDVHIITGRRVSDGALDEIKELGLSYTHFFSISDYHVEIGTKVWEDDEGNPWLEGELWDRTKGDYCAKHKIDFHIDDTERYGDYFKTNFMLSKIFKRAE